MRKTLLTIILFLFNLLSIVNAQSIVGFWEVKEVTVAGKITTPVAKWTKINTDGSYQSGNGGIQNSEGTWSFDEKNKIFLPVETKGIKEPYGGFKVTYQEALMIWERQEDGDRVVVKLERTNKFPKSHADMLVGLWDLKEIVKNGRSQTSTFDPDNKYYIFIRWDRVYVERNTAGQKVFGYWHINAHRPELTFLPHSEEKKDESWTITVNAEELKMEGISDSNKGTLIVYSRLYEFPK